jgi:hypothetical protein
VLLLHDIHPATVMALPTLLRELKARGYSIVQAVAAGERPNSVPETGEPMVAEKAGWPRIVAPATETPVKVAALRRHKRVARKETDGDVTASLAAKKTKTKNADNSGGWTLLFRR